MKKYLLGLIGLALLGGSSTAQAPALMPATPPAGAPVVVVETQGAGCSSCCTSSCPTCVPEHYLKPVKHINYGSGCEDFCICYYHGWSLFGTCDCDNGHCGEVHTRRYLLKKIRVCDEDAVKCVVGEAPATCGTPCTTTAPCCGGSYAPNH